MVRVKGFSCGKWSIVRGRGWDNMSVFCRIRRRFGSLLWEFSKRSLFALVIFLGKRRIILY